jgi:predicted metal-dependent hydrolase
MNKQALLLADTALAEALGDPALATRIVVDINTRARRVAVRLDPGAGCVVLVRPPRMSDRAVMAFLASRRQWIARHLGALPPRVTFADGAVISFAGVDHTIRHTPEARGGVWCDTTCKEIVVSGRSEHVPRRLRDWLKAQARARLSQYCQDFAAQLDVKVTRISVRDTRSRWGSATRGGRLSFSWRLILAPEAVQLYVAAHEVAHLRHMNHSPAFWRTVDGLLGAGLFGGGSDAQLARAWLRRSGAALHRYG